MKKFKEYFHDQLSLTKSKEQWIEWHKHTLFNPDNRVSPPQMGDHDIDTALRSLWDQCDEGISRETALGFVRMFRFIDPQAPVEALKYRYIGIDEIGTIRAYHPRAERYFTGRASQVGKIIKRKKG